MSVPNKIQTWQMVEGPFLTKRPRKSRLPASWRRPKFRFLILAPEKFLSRLRGAVSATQTWPIL